MEHESGEMHPLVESDNEVKEFGFNVCNRQKRSDFKYAGLALLCFLIIGNAFCISIPTAIQEHFIKDLNISMATLALLNSLRTWSSVVGCFISGYLIDHVFGIRLGSIVFTALVLVGHSLFSFGAFTNQVWLMGAGMLIFG